MNEPDPRTIRAAAAGDLDAFTEIMRESQPHVWRFLRHLLDDPDLAADLTQETFVRVHRSLAGFRFDARFSTWLFRIARNLAIDEQRRQKRRRLRVVNDEPSVAGPALGTELAAALDSLDAPHREAFILVEVFGLRYREVAEVLDVPDGTVKSRVFTARRSLIEWFGAADDAPPGKAHNDER